MKLTMESHAAVSGAALLQAGAVHGMIRDGAELMIGKVRRKMVKSVFDLFASGHRNSLVFTHESFKLS